ncbi:MAG TPA: PAS domain-containing protein [Kofleriaceae bacterium]
MDEIALDARREADDARAERDRLLGQLREANEKLVTAIVEAQQLADEANAARVAADYNEERFRSLVYTSSAIVWQATPDGQVQVDHDTWRRFTGVDPEQDEGGWLEAVHPHDQDRVRNAWTEAVATARSYTCEHRIRSCDGGYAWVVARAVPIPKTGTVREWVGMMTDISDRVRVEQAREQFIGILGHDLRNPVAAILMAVEVLGGLPEPYSAVVGRVTRSAHRIEGMIRDLLDFARGRLASGIPIAPRPCDLQALCGEVVEEMKQAHPDRAISFEAAGALRGAWDPDRVEQVISNLVGNAVTHGEELLARLHGLRSHARRRVACDELPDGHCKVRRHASPFFACDVAHPSIRPQRRGSRRHARCIKVEIDKYIHFGGCHGIDRIEHQQDHNEAGRPDRTLERQARRSRREGRRGRPGRQARGARSARRAEVQARRRTIEARRGKGRRRRQVGRLQGRRGELMERARKCLQEVDSLVFASRPHDTIPGAVLCGRSAHGRNRSPTSDAQDDAG